MIIQAGTDDFPRYWDRVLFVAGLAIYTTGQVLINLGRDFVEAQTPIDFAHWLLLLGVLFLIPFTGRLPRRNLHLLTLPLLIAGIAAVIGMCLIDFIFWSLPAGDLENRLASELIATPSIWPVFITIGPNHVFSLALMLPSLSWYRASRAGTALVIIGTLTVMLGVQWFNVIGYAVLTLGYGLNFNGLRPPDRADP
ncbi:hypothetical protein [Maricaulis sp.]|uniref:hypothetical protein n=1 Tax=Maricaulis sp. TaxID=1486257 RepID=UPI003A91E832